MISSCEYSRITRNTMKTATLLVLCVTVFCVEANRNRYRYANTLLRANTVLLEPVLGIYVPTSEAIKNEKCRRHSDDYKIGLGNNQKWALQMLDASSKVPSGLLEGNTVQLGNYEECLGVEDDFMEWSGQHCMVGMSHVVGWYTNTTNFRGINTDILREFVLLLGSKWSVCIPSSCTPQDLQAHLSSVLEDMVAGFNVTVKEDACRSRAHPTVLTPADWVAIALLTFFALLIVVSTAYDLISRKAASRSPLFVSYSIYTNGRKLLTLSPGSDDLQVLHGIRTLSMIWIVVGHTYDLMLESPAVNAIQAESILKSWSHAALMNYRHSVDSFLLLSGTLLCYGFLKEMTRGGTFNIGRFYLHRYIRLTPAYAVMILLTATLLDNSDDGPLWQEVVGAAQKNCKHYWWAGLLYVNNYVYPMDTCMDQSWYLSVDMQLYLLSPMLLYPLWRWRKVTKYLLGCIIIVGIITAFTIGWIYDFAMNAEADSNVSEYYPTHARFTPWVMGVALGYYLHTTKSTRPNLSRRVVTGGWVLGAALLISSIIVNHAIKQGHVRYSRWAESLNSGLNKPAWTLGVAWIVFACSKGCGGFINTFLSSKIFQLLSRLTYSVYLVHFAFILWLTGSFRTPIYLNDRAMLQMILLVTVMSFAAALVLSLAFEVPALAIEKVLLGKDSRKDEKTQKYVAEDGATKDNKNGPELIEIIGCDATSEES